VLVLARPETSGLFKVLIVAMMLVAGVFVLALCVDGVCPSCAHEYYGNADRSKHLVARLTLGMRVALANFFTSSRVSLLAAIHEVSLAVRLDVPGDPLHQAMALRI